MTVDGPQPNKRCIFPFTFNGRSHNTCITGKIRTRPWCSTKENYARGQWGYCSLTCPPTMPDQRNFPNVDCGEDRDSRKIPEHLPSDDFEFIFGGQDTVIIKVIFLI